jgi:hypothetical protein
VDINDLEVEKIGFLRSVCIWLTDHEPLTLQASQRFAKLHP